MLTTIGYEGSTQEDFLAALQGSGVEILVDIRERAQSRKRGFSKSSLSAAVSDAGMEYLHFRALGDPKEGRDAARAGLYEQFQDIFAKVLAGDAAQFALSEIKEIAKSKRICLMCYERDPLYCHRKIVSDHLEQSLGCEVIHLGVAENGAKRHNKRRVLHSCEGAAA